MIAGHFAFAAAVRSRERSAPLWALMLATQWLDVVFVPLFAAGVEGMRRAPGAPPGYGEGLFHIPWTHSLLGAAVLAGCFGAVNALHRPDLPLVPWGGPSLGLGLWNARGASTLLELLAVLSSGIVTLGLNALGS